MLRIIITSPGSSIIINTDSIEKAADNLKKGIEGACTKICEWIDKAHSDITGLFKCITGNGCTCPCCTNPENCCNGKITECTCKCNSGKGCLKCIVITTSNNICKQIESGCNEISNAIAGTLYSSIITSSFSRCINFGSLTRITTGAAQALKNGVNTACGKICEWIGKANNTISNLLICPKEKKGNGQCPCSQEDSECGGSGSSEENCESKCTKGGKSLQCGVKRTAQCIYCKMHMCIYAYCIECSIPLVQSNF